MAEDRNGLSDILVFCEGILIDQIFRSVTLGRRDILTVVDNL